MVVGVSCVLLKFFAYGAAASIRMALRGKGLGIYVRLSISDEGENRTRPIS
jgi:hypothetical protein